MQAFLILSSVFGNMDESTVGIGAWCAPPREIVDVVHRNSCFVATLQPGPVTNMFIWYTVLI